MNMRRNYVAYKRVKYTIVKFKKPGFLGKMFSSSQID